MKLMKSLGTFSMVALVGAAISLFGAAPASAGIGSELLTVVNAGNINEVLTPPAGVKYTNVFVEICPAAEKVCQDEVAKLGMGAAVAAGGWMGPKLGHGMLQFYVMDPTPANLQALGAACKAAATNAPGAALCSADTKKFPLLVMFRTDGSKSDVKVGPSQPGNFNTEIWQFTK
jgi:hypothetical protein